MALYVESFEYSIDVPNPCKFCTNKRENILTYLNENLVHTCFQGCMIMSIIDVSEQRTSLCRIITSNSTGYGNINFEFTANVLRYPRGIVVPKVRVETKEGLIFAKGEYITVDLSNKEGTSHRMLREGQYIPVIITNMIYPNCSRSVTATGRLVTCANNVKYWRTEGTLTQKDVSELRRIVENTLIPLPNTKEYKFVSNILYSYRKEVQPPKGTIDILDVIREGYDMRGYWYKDLSIHQDSTLFVRSDTLPDTAISDKSKVGELHTSHLYKNGGSLTSPDISADAEDESSTTKTRAKPKAKAKPKSKASKYNNTNINTPVSSYNDIISLTGNINESKQLSIKQDIQRVQIEILSPIDTLSMMLSSVISWRNAINDISQQYSIEDDKYLWTILENNKL